MQRLNIPLSRNHKTTRRNRWVVWKLVFIAVLVLFFFSVSKAFFQRNTLMQAAPDGTTTALFLTPNDSNRPIINELIGTIPLITNRSITLDDLEPYAHGRIAVFFGANGTRSVALRATKQDLPLQKLDGSHVNVQEVKKGLLLLSETLQPISGMHVKWNWHQLLPIFRKKSLGTLVFAESLRPAPLLATEDHVEISMRDKEIPKKSSPLLPPNTIGFISTPLFAGFSQNSSDLFSNLVDPVLNNSLLSYTNTLFSNNGLVVLSKDDNGLGFLIESTSQEYDKNLRIQLLKTISSLQNPNILTKTLQDGSVVREISVDPGAVSVEERTILGIQTLRTKTQSKGSYLLSSEGDFVFSNNEALLRFSLEKEKNSALVSFCDGNAIGADVRELISQHQNNFEHYTPSLLRVMSQQFNKFGAEKKGNSLIIRMCK